MYEKGVNEFIAFFFRYLAPIKKNSKAKTLTLILYEAVSDMYEHFKYEAVLSKYARFI